MNKCKDCKHEAKAGFLCSYVRCVHRADMIYDDFEPKEPKVHDEPLCHSCKKYVINSGGSYFCDIGVENGMKDNKCLHYSKEKPRG